MYFGFPMGLTFDRDMKFTFFKTIFLLPNIAQRQLFQGSKLSAATMLLLLLHLLLLLLILAPPSVSFHAKPTSINVMELELCLLMI